MALIFFANFNNNILLVTELIGTEAEPCILMLGGQLNSPAGVFVQNNTIYWTNYFESTIYKGILNGNNVINNPQQLTGGMVDLPNGISVNPSSSKIYWVNQEDEALTVGKIYAADLSDTFISNQVALNIPSDKLGGTNGLFIDYTQNPLKIYWTNYLVDTMFRGDLSDATVSNIQSLTNGLVPGTELLGPSGIFVDTSTNQIYWSNYLNNTVLVGDLSDVQISNKQFITGPNFSGPNGIFLASGSFSTDDIIAGSCDPTCANCVGLFMQFSDLSKTIRPTLDLENSDDRQILASALSLQSTYCFKVDWRNSSQLFGSAKSIQTILNTSDKDLDPLLLDFKNALLSVQKEHDCCDLMSDLPI